jgi:hypothetical protein
MWNGTTMVLMATYNNAIDPRPKKASQNLVTSGGVFDNMGALDVSELNATENPHTIAKYVDLSAALAAVLTDYQKGGMSIKFVQSSDNNYVQFRCMADEFTTDVTKWQGVDAKLLAGSHNFIENGNLKKVIDNATLNRRCVDVIDFPTSRHDSSYYYINGVTLYSGHTYLISCSSDTSITSSQLSIKFVDSNKNNLASKNFLINNINNILILLSKFIKIDKIYSIGSIL